MSLTGRNRSNFGEKIRMTNAPLYQLSKKPVVIVEIGNDWLKVVEGHPASKEGVISKVSFKKLVEIKEPVTDALARIFRELKLSKQGVIACIPRHLVTVRILEFPSTNPKDIRDMVSLQVGKQTPYSREEILFTYKTVSVAKEGYTKIMLVIARCNLVNARVDVLQKAGIEVDHVAMSSEGLFNWFAAAYLPEASPVKNKIYDDVKAENQAIIFIDVDSNYSDLLVIRNDKLVYTRNFLIGANHLLEEGDKWREKFADETIHSMGLYQNEERDARIVKIFLGGAAKHNAGLDVSLKTRVDLAVEMTEPLKNVRTQKWVNFSEVRDCKFISSCALIGMALNPEMLELDLTSSELRIKKQMEERRTKITTTGILALSIVTMMSILFFTGYYNKNAYLSQLKRATAKISKDAEGVERMRLCIDLVEKRLNTQRCSLNILNEIAKLTPKEIYFTSIDIDEKKQAVLQGRAAAMSNVFEFVTTLENSPFFENVKTTYTTTKKDKDTEYAKFEIICMNEGAGEGYTDVLGQTF